VAAELRLEPLGLEHLEGVRGLVDDAETLRFTRVPQPPPEGFAEQWIARYVEGRKDGSAEGFAIVDGDGTFLGLALAPTILRDPEWTAELGYCVVEAARGRGVATEALRQLTEWALAEGMLRVELVISPENEGSKRVAQRAGYVYEGLLRSKYFKDGRREDQEIWSRLPTDPHPA
jgi:RimJ/RimL family protein N-acetyltransferase